MGEMLETLRQAGGQAARDRVTHQRDEGVEKIVASGRDVSITSVRWR